MALGVEEVRLEEAVARDPDGGELDAEVRVDEGLSRPRHLETEARQCIDEDVGGDLHVASVGCDREAAHGADGHATPLDG